MNSRHRWFYYLVLAMLAAAPGCGNESSSQKAGADTTKPQPAVMAPQIAEPPSIAPPPGAVPSGTIPAAAVATSTAPGTVLPDTGPAPGMVREVAKAGVTGKGGYEEGILAPWTTPLNTYWSAKEMAMYDIAIPRAMQLFEFEKQRKPESHEEFMREIIKRNNYKLPELPPGVRYVYDPKRGQLMVERPIAPETTVK